MSSLKDELKKDNVIPKLRLATQLPEGGIESTGKHTLKKLADKVEIIDGKKMVKVLVEENGEKKKWIFDYYDKNGEVDYKAIRLSEIEVGDTFTAEVKMGKNGRNFTSIQKVGEEIATVQLDEPEGSNRGGEGEEDISPEDIPF